MVRTRKENRKCVQGLFPNVWEMSFFDAYRNFLKEWSASLTIEIARKLDEKSNLRAFLAVRKLYSIECSDLVLEIVIIFQCYVFWIVMQDLQLTLLKK